MVAEDAEFMLGLLNQPSFLQYIGDKGVRTVEDAREYIRTGPIASYERFGFGLYITARRSDQTSLGICGLLKRDALSDVDIGFAFLPEFWGQGYALESAAAVLSHGRSSFGLTRIVAIVAPDNLGSIRLVERLGLAFERMVKLSDGGSELRLFALEHADTTT
jgi:ribosomal-protein-alanine N-acetyltransferase